MRFHVIVEIEHTGAIQRIGPKSALVTFVSPLANHDIPKSDTLQTHSCVTRMFLAARSL